MEEHAAEDALPPLGAERPVGGRVASKAMSWIQAPAAFSGGSSSALARRAGRLHRGAEVRSRPIASGTNGPIWTSATGLSNTETGGAFGSPEPPHGAQLRQGFPPGGACEASAAGMEVPTDRSRGSQQQDASRHRVLHLHW